MMGVHIHLNYNCQPFVEGIYLYISSLATTSNLYTLIHFSNSIGTLTFFLYNVSTHHDNHPL